MFDSLFNKIVLCIYPTKKGKKLKINGKINRRGRGRVVVGDNVTINSSKKSNILGGSDYTTIYAKMGGEVIIGNDTGISNACIIAFEKIEIGNNVLVGADCKIYDTDFHSLDYNLRGKIEKDIPKCAPIRIEDNAFIGAHSIILKGVTVGRCSIVGAGSVVTHSIPANEIWAGNPARFIRKC